jgi:hypothetical protein
MIASAFVPIYLKSTGRSRKKQASQTDVRLKGAELANITLPRKYSLAPRSWHS